MLYRISHHLLPVQILHLLPDYPEDFSKLLVCAGLQVHLFGDSVKELVVADTESVDVGVDGQLKHPRVWRLHSVVSLK